MTRPIRVIVAEDQELFRQGLVTLLSTMRQVRVVGEAGDGLEAVRMAVREQPDVVLMDLRMPGLDGAGATRRLRAEAPRVRVVVLTTFGDDESIFEALRAGALGYLLKDVSADALSAALVSAASGQAFLTPSVATKVVHQIANSPAPPAPCSERLKRLTRRERQVLEMLGRGASNKEIACALHVTEGTAKNHLTSVFTKLQVGDRLQAALLARELGIPP